MFAYKKCVFLLQKNNYDTLLCHQRSASDADMEDDIHTPELVKNDSDVVCSSESDEYPDTSSSSDESNDSDTDLDWKIFPISLDNVDDVCIRLNELIQEGKISTDGIFYKHIKDVVHMMQAPLTHQYDKDIVEFFKTVRYLGGEKTANFLRGPMFHGQGQLGKGKFNFHEAQGNMFGPSTKTCEKQQAGYTCKSGIHHHLLQAYLKIINTSNVEVFYEDDYVKVFPSSVQNDGTALAAGLRFDERTKTVVGLTQPEMDIAFVKANPTPDVGAP